MDDDEADQVIEELEERVATKRVIETYATRKTKRSSIRP